MKRFAVVALILSLSSCGDAPESKGLDPKTAAPNDVVLESYKLIDQDRSDEAVNLLEAAITTHPDDISLRSTLASAFAHKAGVKIQTLYPTFKKILALAKANRDAKTAQPDEDTPILDQRLKTLAQASQKVNAILDIFLSLPQLDRHGVLLVQEAVSEFEPVSRSLGKGDLVYRAVLRALLVRSELTDGIQASLSKNDKGQCQLDLDKFQSTLLRINRLATETFADLALTDKSETEEWMDRISETSKIVEGLTLTSSTLIVLDEALGALSKKQVFGPLLGDWIGCDP